MCRTLLIIIVASPLLAADTNTLHFFGEPDKDGFRSIFDGETLAGWECVDMSYWSVRDGAITGQSTG